MEDPTTNYPPRILSDEEIEMYLKGERQEVDRLILFSLNRLAACLIPHARREADRDQAQALLLKSLGGEEALLARARFVDALVKQSDARTRMMEKVSQSSVTWALLVFFGFVAAACWDALTQAIKLKLGGN